MAATQRLLELLALEQIEVNLFRGQSHSIGSKRVFGGQVLGQALSAAAQTVEIADRYVHSLHAYFILPGDVNAPIIYNVDRMRDGGSFTTRRVTAIQHGAAIFNMAASFHKHEDGFEHQDELPDVPFPEELSDASDVRKQLAALAPESMRSLFEENWLIDSRMVNPIDLQNPQKEDPVKYVWFRCREALPDDIFMHKCALAYASDFNLLTTSLQPHGVSFIHPKLQIASLDHAIWFYHTFRADDWLLYALESPVAAHARGLSRGHIYTREGVLVASVVQEGLIRLRKDK